MFFLFVCFFWWTSVFLKPICGAREGKKNLFYAFLIIFFLSLKKTFFFSSHFLFSSRPAASTNRLIIVCLFLFFFFTFLKLGTVWWVFFFPLESEKNKTFSSLSLVAAAAAHADTRLIGRLPAQKRAVLCSLDVSLPSAVQNNVQPSERLISPSIHLDRKQMGIVWVLWRLLSLFHWVLLIYQSCPRAWTFRNTMTTEAVFFFLLLLFF